MSLIKKGNELPQSTSSSKLKKYLTVSAFILSLSAQQAIAGQGNYNADSSSRYDSYNTSLSVELKNRMGKRWDRAVNNDARNYQPESKVQSGYWQYVAPQIAKTNVEVLPDYPIYFD